MRKACGYWKVEKGIAGGLKIVFIRCGWRRCEWLLFKKLSRRSTSTFGPSLSGTSPSGSEIRSSSSVTLRAILSSVLSISGQI